MRLLALNWRDIRSPEAGGAELHLHEILKRLVERGHQVTLVCAQFAHGKGARAEWVDGIRTLRVGRWWNAHITVPREARRLMRAEDFDLVLDDVNKIPFFAPRWSRVPVVGLFLHLLGRTLFLETNPITASWLWLMERRVGRVYRDVPKVAISNSTGEELCALGCRRESIAVIPPGLDHERYKPQGTPKAFPPRLVVVSRLKRYKRVDVAIRALALIRDDIPDATLTVMGTGDHRPRLERLARRLDLPVAFCGHVPEERKIQHLESATLALNPSVKEGWGLVGVEAMACGTPVVASDVPGHRDSVPEGAGTLVPYGDPGTMAREAVRLVRDVKLYDDFRRRGLQWARRHTWDDVADRFEQVLLASRSTAPAQAAPTEGAAS